jgi:hypothetical protein|tara:strand:- start:79 stop:507 length:429 start_codon:yes stop_codon:yes gene_type:complete
MAQRRRRRYCPGVRFLLVLLLTFSQAIAPALHAHVGGEHYGDGAHLHNPLEHGHAAAAGADIESIEGRIVGVALSLVSRACRIASPQAGDADATPALALSSNFNDIALPLRTRVPAPTIDASLRNHHQEACFLPHRRGPPTA